MKKLTILCLSLLATLMTTSCVETYPGPGYAYRDYDSYHAGYWNRDRYHHHRGDWDRHNDRRFASARYNDRFVRTSIHAHY